MTVTWVKDYNSSMDFNVRSIVDIEEKAKKIGFIPNGDWGYDSECEAYSLPGKNGVIMVSAPLL